MLNAMRHLLAGAAASAALLSPVAGVRADTFAISSPEWVEDAPLLSGEFAHWNFGSAPLLEVGLMGGIYTEHRATSVIRFDVGAAPIANVTAAKLRLYKPKDFVQTRPVKVFLHEVTVSGWTEGADILTAGTGVKGSDKIDHRSAPVAAATAPDDCSAWLEFSLPPDLIQRWLDDPKANAGLLLSVALDDQRQWGDHVYFHSSEHYLGNPPQLVVEGSAGPARPPVRREPKARLISLPPESSLDPWLKNSSRLARFAKALDATPAQARVLHLFDTTVRDQFIVARYQAPFRRIIDEIQPLIEKNDESALRARLDEVHQLLLTWEYIRETMWYTSGPLADTLTPRQLNRLFADQIFGQMESAARKNGDEIWQVILDDKLADHVRRVLADLAERLSLSTDQLRALTPGITHHETEENRYLALFRRDLTRCQQMLESDADGPEVFAAVRDLHLHHELFLYHQSIYNTPRWTLFLGHAPTVPFARWIAGVRRDHYDRAVRGAAQRKADNNEE